jgi:hypothetical protein
VMDFHPRIPKWRQVADEIQRRIEAGEIGYNDVISEVQLERELEVPRPTIRQNSRNPLPVISTGPAIQVRPSPALPGSTGPGPPRHRRR